MARAMQDIEAEMWERVKFFEEHDKLLEAQRIRQRTQYDLEMLSEIGFCTGIENYSRVIAGRAPGTPPTTLIDYFPDDFLLFVDESHVTLPQVRAMYNGDHSRKQSLVDYGFRLPSAYDNRPLKFDEFEAKIHQAIYVSATPGEYERERAGQIAEQVIRPTGLLDPEVFVRPIEGQIDDLIGEIRGYFAAKTETLRSAGVEQIVLDPGFGFSKTVDQNFMLLGRMGETFRDTGLPFLAGISRKSMIYRTLDTTPDDALTGTSALHWECLRQGASILRVHDVREAAQVIALWNRFTAANTAKP